MTIIPKKEHWLDRAVQVYNFHIKQIKTESNWTMLKTATALNRSLGSISNDIAIANWSKTHEKQLRRLKSARMALDYIHGKEKERLSEI